jgi:hypothetical protein
MATYFEGAVKQGTNPSEYGNDVGYATFVRTATLQAATVSNVDATIPVPRGAQILSITADTSVAWTATGAVTFTAGITAGGTEYITSVDLKTVVRSAPTLTAAQVGAMANVGTNTNVVVRANSASGANATGTTLVTVLYAAKL